MQAWTQRTSALRSFYIPYNTMAVLPVEFENGRHASHSLKTFVQRLCDFSMIILFGTKLWQWQN